MDVIFCRNVFIYFDKNTQEQIVRKFAQNAAAGSYLFVGHSENLHNLEIPYEQVAPTVYRRR
jgi:chemotaxis protein methyltransferase CheR